jgi:flagellar biosynthesis/type III secretory pathway ATPase
VSVPDAIDDIALIPEHRRFGRVTGVLGPLLEVGEDMAELIRLGACRRGSDPEIDEAIGRHPLIEAFPARAKDERADLARGYSQLAALLKAPA